MGPEASLRGAAAGLRGLAREHPKLVTLLTSREVPLGDPETAEPFEAGLAAFVAAGYDVAGAFAALQAAALSLLSMAQLEALSALGDPDGDAPADEAGLGTLPASEFPLLHAMVGLRLTPAASLDSFWSALVDGLVRGLAAPA